VVWGARIVVASGYSDDPVMANYKEFGLLGVLMKPFTLDELKRAIGSVLAPR